MDLAQVVGAVVSTQKSESLLGRKLLLVQPIDTSGQISSHSQFSTQVAVDCVGAGDGEIVLLTRGSSARACLDDDRSAADLCIVAILDSLSVTEN